MLGEMPVFRYFMVFSAIVTIGEKTVFENHSVFCVGGLMPC